VWDGNKYGGHAGFGTIEEKSDSLILQDCAETHTRDCIVCRNHIYYSYYLNQYGNGKLYNITMGKTGNYAEYCQNIYEDRLTCNNPGMCVKCGNNISGHARWYVNLENGYFGCFGCDEIWGTDFQLYDQYILSDFKTGSVTEYVPIELYQDDKYAQMLSNISEDKKKFTITIQVKMKDNVKNKQYIESYFYINGVATYVEGAYAYQDRIKPEIIEISSVTNIGFDELMFKIADTLDSISNDSLYDDAEMISHVMYKFQNERPFSITKDGNVWILEGRELEKLFKMTRFNEPDAVLRFARKLKGMGVEEELERLGAKRGDEVQICDYIFEFKE